MLSVKALQSGRSVVVLKITKLKILEGGWKVLLITINMIWNLVEVKRACKYIYNNKNRDILGDLSCCVLKKTDWKNEVIASCGAISTTKKN